jgi:hypothetical protein
MAARVNDFVDGAGTGHTLRAYLRAALHKTPTLSDAIAEVLALECEDSQWMFLATLAARILDCKERELEFVSLGRAEINLLRVTDAKLQRLGDDPLLPVSGIRIGRLLGRRANI